VQLKYKYYFFKFQEYIQILSGPILQRAHRLSGLKELQNLKPS
jgi:hypothetical protein